MTSFLGHFHPLFVHLPIGILVVGLLFKAISLKSENPIYEAILPAVLLASFLSSVFSAGSGYLLSLSGGYEKDLLGYHQWAGIALTVLTGVLYFLVTKNKIKPLQNVFWIVSAGLLGITGHLGGSLTHGENFLSFSEEKYQKPVIVNLSEAKVYTEIIEPIFAEKCWSCHSAKKQKGGLRMDGKAFITKGGEDGAAFLAHQAAKSRIILRAQLNEKDEEHMPPAGKPQLTEKELKLIAWWINEGADFNKKVKELKATAEIKLILANLSTPTISQAEPDVPKENIDAADEKVIVLIKNEGVTIVPVAINSNYLLVNFNGREVKETVWENLKKIGDNVVWLKAKNLTVGNGNLEVIQLMKNLYQLDLSSSNIKNEDLAKLAELKNLRVLNLNYTNVSFQGLEALKNLKSLRSIYLFSSKISKTDWPKLKAMFPKTQLDSGNYQVPTFEQDTLILKKEDLVSE